MDNHILMDFDKETFPSSNSESKRFTKNIPIQDWKKKNRVLIMQHSAVTNFDDRQENRETWMQSLKVRSIHTYKKYIILLKFQMTMLRIRKNV